MLKGDLFKRMLFWVAGLFFVCFSFYVWQIFKTPNFKTATKDGFYLYIPSESANYETVLDSLKKYEIVKDEMSFRFLAKLLKYPQNVKAGRYFIGEKMGNHELLKKLKAGEQTPVRLTFNNVRLKEDLIKKIGTKFEFDSTAFAQKLRDTTFIRRYGFDQETVMCMFLPNTYEVFWNTTPEKLFDRMKFEHDRFWNEKRRAQAQAIGFSPVQVQILASIVEEEQGRKTDERPRVAGLYVNRLNTQMPLQADPTIKFALKNFGLKRILNLHLSVSSPYNTYRNTGLPPGPIRLADLNSIEAVLNYERHPYTYMCASPDFSGYHVFSDNYKDHLLNAGLYQEALNKLNIK
jgi:UPF0755 protein